MAGRGHKRRRRRSRGRFGFLYKLLSVLAITAAIVVGCLAFFRVQQVVVTGHAKYSEGEIIEAAGIKMGNNLYGINRMQAEAYIRTLLPYVDEARVERKLPDTILITITECKSAAVVRSESGYWLIDAKCKLLERGDGLPDGKALVRGLTPAGPTAGLELSVAEEYRSKLGALKGLLAGLAKWQMTGSVTDFIDLTAENELRFSYGAHLTVVMPLYTDDYEGYVFKLRQTLLDMDRRGVERSGTLDLTYEGEAHLFVERWLPEEDAAPLPEPTAPVQTTPPEQAAP